MKITKAPKRLAPAAPEVSELLARAAAASDDELPQILDSISEWCWPRGDLHYWTQTLNRFDSILEETCRDYELHKLQINEFTPLRKRLVVSIVRFSRLLIENCTNRKLYNSYEHLNDLLFTRDLDVLEATLRLILRPAQQHSSSSSSRHELPISQERLSTLALTWGPRDHGLELVDVAQDETVIPPELLHVRFQFYRRIDPAEAALASGPGEANDDFAKNPPATPTRPKGKSVTMAGSLLAGPSTPTHPSTPAAASRSSESSNEGLTTVDLGMVTQLGRSAMDILADAVEAHKIPAQDRFELFQKIRVAMCLPDPKARRQLLLCRLLAIACYAHVVPESHAQTQLFLYEPDLIQRIATLVKPESHVCQTVQSGAFFALDALGRYRGKLNEVLNSVNASVNHGILLHVLRNTIADLATDKPASVDFFVDSLFAFIAFVTSTAAGSNMIVSAGLIPLLVQLVEIVNPTTYLVQRTISRAIGLIDSVIYAFPPAFQLFCNAHGLDIMVSRIKSEVDRDIADGDATMDTNGFGEPGPDNLYGKLPFGRASLLRNMFKSISHMMSSTGTAEGLRNLIDSSLLESVKRIMEHRRIFGPQILALAINIMATFVHNEPTSLTIIQEAKLPETFLSVVEEDIEANYDVIAAIPNAVGALCLNQAGLDLLNSRPLVPKFMSLFTSERHSRVLQDRDNASMFGSSIDELIRHQPSIKQSVIDAILHTLKAIEEAGQAFTPPEDETRSNYVLLHAPPPAGDTAEASSSAGEVRSVALADVVMDEDDTVRKPDAVKDNAVVVFMDVTARFLEGFFQTTSHCKDFIKADGLDLLLRLYSLPCLPYNFSSSIAADSLVTLIRFMCVVSSTSVLTGILRDVKRSLEETEDVWQDGSHTSKLLALLQASDTDDLESANQEFRKLVSLNARTHLLADNWYFLQTLNGETQGLLNIAQLGELQRVCTWENMLLKAAVPTVKEPAKEEAKSSEGSDDSTQTPAAAHLQPGMPENLLGNMPAASETAKPATPEQSPDDPRVKNATALKYVASQISASLTSFFQDTSRLLVWRRSTDSNHKKQALQIAKDIATMLCKHLEWRDSSNPSNNFAYATMMIGHATSLLYNDRASQGGPQTILLIAFERAGGLPALFNIYQKYSAELDRYFDNGNTSQDPEAGIRLGHVCGGLKVALNLLQNLSASKPLLDSSQTSLLASKEDQRGSPDFFEPHEFVIRLRAAILPVVRETWTKTWLPSLPLSVNRSVIQTILNILQADGESSPKPPAVPQSGSLSGGLSAALAGIGNLPGLRRQPVQIDDDRIRHLTDMGFPRNAARHALSRCQNNLSAATEYLLLHPDIVATMGAEPASDDAPAESGSTGATQAQAESGATAEMNTDQPTASPAGVDGDMQMTGPEAGSSNSKEPESAARAIKEKLDSERQELLATLTQRALELADHHEALVFDCKDAFGLASSDSSKGAAALISLLDDVRKSQESAFDSREHVVAVRLRLLALMLNDSDVIKKLGDNLARQIMEVINALVASYQQRESKDKHAKWLASLLLVAASLLSLDEDTVEVQVIDTEASQPPILPSSARRPPLFEAEARVLFDTSLHVLEQSDQLARDDLLSVYRLLVILTRRHSFAAEFVKRNGMQALFHPFQSTSGRDVPGCQTYAVLILRHIVEDTSTLRLTMQQELQGWFAQSRTKAVDTSALVRHFNHAALRDPDVFVDAVKSNFEMADYSTSKGVGYVRVPERANDAAPKDATSASAKDADVPADTTIDMPASPTKGADLPVADLDAQMEDASKHPQAQTKEPIAPTEALDSIMQFLLSELLKHARDGLSAFHQAAQNAKKASGGTAKAGPADPLAMQSAGGDSADKAKSTEENDASSEEKKGEDSVYVYTCLIMQCLTELLSSYTSCKVSFINFSKKRLFGKDVNTPSKPKAGVLNFFLSELVPLGFLQSFFDTELRKRMAQSNWAMSVIVALTADVTLHTDVKEVAPELINVRKFVLDGLAKAIKDASASSEPIEVRYGRLYALADLCYRLLTARPNSTASKQTEDLTLHMAKTMLERNFVTVLTGALADVDLNLPSVKALLDCIVRPLEHLTKVAIKMGKAERKGEVDPTQIPLDSESDELDSSDYDMSEDDYDEPPPEREETPDFYRNSSLGMHTGEMEPSYEGDEMSDEMEDDEDVEMEEYDSDEEGSDESDDDEDVDERVVEVMEEGDEDEEDGDDELEEGEEEGGSWVDEDEEDEEGLSDDGSDESEALDFVLGDGDEMEGPLDATLDAAGDLGIEDDGPHPADMLMDDDDQDPEDEDQDSIGDPYEHDDLAQLELADHGRDQPDDRFGANWGWTQLPFSRDGAPDGAVRGQMAALPNPFVMGGPPGGPSRHRHRLLDFEHDMLGGAMPRRPNNPSDDVGSHPLLVDEQDIAGSRAQANSRSATRRGGRSGGYHDWVRSIEDLVGGGAMQFLETLLNRSGGADASIRIELAPNGAGGPRMHVGGVGMERGLPGMEDIRRRGGGSSRDATDSSRRPADPVAVVQEFTPMPTQSRWSDECRIVHGMMATERNNKLRNHVINALMPGLKERLKEAEKKQEEAERERKAKEKELEEAKRHRDEAAKALEEAKAKMEAAEKQAAEEQGGDVEMADATPSAADTTGPPQRTEATGATSTPGEVHPANLELGSLQQGLAELDRSSPETPVTAQSTAGQQGTEGSGGAEASGSQSQPEASQAVSSNEASGSSQAAPSARVTTTIHGSTIDITDTGIDPTFLEALPDDMREEVLNQHFRERRAATATAGQPTNIAPEFLDALPPEIRAEVIAQEAMESARRERDEAASRRRENEDNSAAAPAEIDPANFIASLAPDLRQAVLMDQDEGFLQSLPPAMVAEVNGYRRQHRRFDQDPRRPRTQNAPASADAGASKKPPPRDAIQLLDKSGVATLVRLLYFPQMSKQTGLHKVLANLSENSKTRGELVSLLLMILQDGTGDSNAVDKSFNQMSMRASKGAATPRPTPKRHNSGPAVLHQVGSSIAPLSRLPGEEAPHLIAARSIETLLHLTTVNEQAAISFLRETETRAAKKGKGKEKADAKDKAAMSAPVNVLLDLLDRKVILDNTQIVESLVALLAIVTKPLLTLAGSTATESKEGGSASQAADNQPADNEQSAVVEGDTDTARQSGVNANATADANADAAGADAKANDGALTTPPHVSPEKLALITKPLTGPCTSRAFQHTLAVASHLSRLEGARDTITAALKAEANAAGEKLVSDLDDVLVSLGSAPVSSGENEAAAAAEGGETIDSPALTSLSLGTSGQSVLLRMLKAIEWLHTGQ